MKVLLVTGIFPPDHGGPASYVPAIASGLKERGHEIVAVITLSDKLNHDDSGFGFSVVRIKRNRLRLIRWFQTITMIHRMARISDVVYLNGLVLEGILATKIFGKNPVVIKVVGDLIWEKARNDDVTHLELDEFQRASLPIRWRCLRSLQAWYTGLADAVITPSKYLSRIVHGWGVNKVSIHTIYNAITTPTVSPAGGNPEYDLVTVTRLVPWKGVTELIQLASANSWSLRIVGDGPMRGELELLAKPFGSLVSFAGHVAHQQVADEICNAKLFILNSTYEGLPHIILEAKAVGLAVLASEAGGTPETIQHGEDGWLFPVGDSNALAMGIRHLLDDDIERTRLAEAGRRQVLDQFSFSVMLTKTETVLQSVTLSYSSRMNR